MISVEEARGLVLADAGPVRRRETVPLARANGRVLAGDLRALRTQPGFDASAMDGYAVRAADAGPPFRTLTVIGESAAGRAYGGAVAAMEAVRIFTGAPVPQGADAILIQENAERLADGRIRASEALEVGRHIRPAGVDFSVDDVVLAKASLLGCGAIALAASAGHPALEVVARPRVAIVATGDELVSPGEPVGPAQIVASNSYGIAAMVEAAGGEVLHYGIAADRKDQISALIDRAVREEADVLATIGGASVGDHDLVGGVFAERKVALDFWKVAMRPGKPLMAGRLGDLRLIGLPGNPASSMVAATLFLKPLVSMLAGRPPVPLYKRGFLAVAMAANDMRAEYVRATTRTDEDGRIRLTPLPRQDSSLLSIYARADALLVRPPHAPAAEAGEECEFVLLD